MTRLLLFVNHFDRGGTESQLVHLASRIEGNPDFEVSIGCHRRGPLQEELGIAPDRIREYGLHRFYSPGGVRQIGRLAWHIARGRYDIVHAQDFYANVMCAAACAWLPSVKLIVSRRYEQRSERRIHRHGERWCYRLADAVLMNSKRIAQRLIQERFVRTEKVAVIPNGIDLSQFRQRAPTDVSRPIRTDDPCRIVVVGRLHPYKGHETLLEATAKLTETWTGLEVILIGDGELRRDLVTMAERLGIADHMTFAGTVADVGPRLESIDVAVLPSLHEGLPNALLEYLAAGLPVVASRVGGVPDIVTDDVHALLVPPLDSGALAASIERLLRNPDLRSRLASAGRQRAEDFAMARMIERTTALYRHLAGTPRGVGLPVTFREALDPV